MEGMNDEWMHDTRDNYDINKNIMNIQLVSTYKIKSRLQYLVDHQAPLGHNGIVCLKHVH